MIQPPPVEIARRAAAVARQRPILTRFAPAPTGYLHIGHVVNAVFVWGLARVVGGRVLLRIEDHDRQRCRADFEAALLDDLEWLGFEPDIHSIAEFRAGVSDGRQSNRAGAYRDALRPLIARGLVYGCDCSRREIGGARYPGTCRTRGIPLTSDVGWRLRIDPGEESFHDLIVGVQTQHPAAEHGDILIRDRHENWTYQLATTTDDHLQGVTLIIRGLDLLDSTGRQLHLARLLGRTQPPVFAHHPLVMKSPTQKVSKSDRDTGVRDLRAAGWSAEALIGHAAWSMGLQAASKPMPASEVASWFGALR